MRNILTATALVATLALAGPAMAVGQFGARLGTGLSMWDMGDTNLKEPDTTPFAVGAAWRMSIMPISIEANALYWMTTGKQDLGTGSLEYSYTDLVLPVIGKFGFPVLPGFFDAEVGLGIEPRFALSAEVDGKDVKDDRESLVWYLPIVVGGTLDLQLLALGLDIRYERQITNAGKGSGADKIRHHQLMFFAGAFF